MDFRNENDRIVITIYGLIGKSFGDYENERLLSFFEKYLNEISLETGDYDILVKDCHKIIKGIRDKNFSKALFFLDSIKARHLCKIVKETVQTYKTKGKDHKDTLECLKFLENVLISLRKAEQKTKWFDRLVKDINMIYDGLTIGNLHRVSYALDSIDSTVNGL